LRDTNNIDLLIDSCQICTDCDPFTCDVTPQSLGLNELYVECAFQDPLLCSADPVNSTLTIERSLTERFNGTLQNGQNNNGIQIDLIALLRNDLPQGETIPNSIIVKKITIQQQGVSTATLLRNGQVVFTETKSSPSPTVYDVPGEVKADTISIGPTNGVSIQYIRELINSDRFQSSQSLANSAAMQDLGRIDDLVSAPSSQTSRQPISSVEEITISLSTANMAFGFGPDGFSDTSPPLSQQTNNGDLHVFICKDVDQDEVCDSNQCIAQIIPTQAVPLTISKSTQPSVVRQDLLQVNEVLELDSDCDTCRLRLSANLQNFIGGTAAADNGFLIQVELIDSFDGSLSHTVVVVGELNQPNQLFTQQGRPYFSDLIPSILVQGSNDYAFQVASPTGGSQLLPADTVVFHPHISKFLQNSQLYPYLFFAQDASKRFHTLIQDTRYWDLNSLLDAQQTPVEILNYFGSLPLNPSAAACQATLNNVQNKENFLNSANTFQFVLDFLTLCARL